MAVLISIDDRFIGNARLGYYNTNATITFTYGGEGARYDEKMEEAIIDVLTMKSQQMWHRIVARSSHDPRPDVRIVEYLVNYGYDSGD